MAALPLVYYPDPRLKEPCAEVSQFDKDLGTLLDRMRETMYKAQGIGLAAPQIGVQRRIAVIDVSEDGSQVYELINPVITAQSGTTSSEEGCLSIPGYKDTIKRALSITLEYRDRDGCLQHLMADGILAICAQHEIDHLNGILFVDHLSRLKREFFRRWFAKQQSEPLR